jgi:putative oxidoreductase
VSESVLARWSQYAALPLRLVLGALFLAGGSQKLFGLFGGAGLSGTAASFATIGIAPGTFWAWVAGLVELVGGAALVLGALTRWSSLVLAAESLVAIVAAAAGAPTNVEFRLAALAGLVALGLIGPQVYALDTTMPALASLEGPAPAEPARKAA